MDAAREIENLIYRYALYLDTGDLPAVAELFRHAELTNSVSDDKIVGYDAILSTYQSATRIYADTGTPKTKHVTTNVIIEVDGDRADTSAYFSVIQGTDALPLQVIIAGRYKDVFECCDKQWRFKSRHMYVDLLGDLSAHLLDAMRDAL